MEKITLSIFVPCFNEEYNITNTLNNIKKGIQNINYEVLVSDDASQDKTIEMVEKFKKNNPNINIKIFHNENNRGVGFNYYATAYKALGKYYMMINGDAVDPPSEISKTVNNIGKADMILTYLIDKRGIFRKILSRIFVFAINLITLNNIKYYNGPNIHLLENVKLYSGERSGFGYQAELITTQIRNRKTYIEIEIGPYPETSFSKSLSPRNITSVIVSIISIFLKQIIYVLKKFSK
jgi:glycosyltransferase involved in cell wall biosynthesis